LKLYDAKEYVQAFEHIEREKTNFPENTWEIAYWRLCMLALPGEETAALEFFKKLWTAASGSLPIDWNMSQT